jgi:hypothetical protein
LKITVSRHNNFYEDRYKGMGSAIIHSATKVFYSMHMHDTLSAVVSIATAIVSCVMASAKEKANSFLTRQYNFHHTHGSDPPLGKVIHLAGLTI